MIMNNFWQVYADKVRQSNPAQDFIREVAEVSGRSEWSVRRWIYSGQVPDHAARKLIAEHFGVDEIEFFNEPSGAQPE